MVVPQMAEVFEDGDVADLVREFVQGEESSGVPPVVEDESMDWDSKFESILKQLDGEGEKE